MRAHLRYIADLLRNSYWFTPALMTLAAIVLSAALLAVDRQVDLEALREVPRLSAWIYTGGAEGAREVLSVIASSMITVAGVVFSITIVALTLASSQFGPRVLANFMRDRGNQTVLGTFIATFIYSLLVLRTIRQDGPDTDAVVPHISVTAALVLALASLSVLIYFIHHVSVSIQAPHLVAAITQELHHSIEGLMSGERDAGSRGEPETCTDRLPERFADDASPIHAEHSGYLEAVDFESLVETAVENGLVLRLDHRPGHFVVRGSVLALAWPGGRLDREIEKHVLRAFVTGSRRTAIQDVEFPVAQLAEIAVRALSPGINDPFTAITCIDQLGAGLCNLARRDFPSPCWTDDEGELRVAIARPITFGGVVSAAFDQIRQNAAVHTAVYIRMLDSIATVIGCVESESRMAPLLRQAQLVLERSAEAVHTAADRRDVEERYRKLLSAADARREELRSGRAS